MAGDMTMVVGYFGQQTSDEFQHPIACFMAMRVVDMLEMVDVAKGDGQRLAIVLRQLHFHLKFLLQLKHHHRRLQPNHPTDDPSGIAASILDGLLYGNGDAMIGINPATDSMSAVCTLLEMLDAVIQRYEIPTQACVLTHVTTSIEAINRGVPLDLVFQSIAGTEAANARFGINLVWAR